MTKRPDLIRALACLALAGGAAVTTLPAANGDIPIYQPTVITQPGHYVVTRDITSTGPSVIIIGEPGSPPFKSLTLDLNGHSLISNYDTPTIFINGSVISRGLTIRNGRLIGSGTGVGEGISAAPSSSPFQIRIEDLEISNFGRFGVYVGSADYVEVARCYIHDIGGMGIYANPMRDAPFTGKFLNNTLERIQETGIYLLDLQGGHLNGNVITNFGLAAGFHAGIWVGTVAGGASTGGGGNQIEGNTVSSLAGGSPTAGIYVDPGIPQNRIADNVIHGSGGMGLSIGSDRNRVVGNITSDNAGHGIFVFSFAARNHLEGNQVQGNSGTGVCGIKFLGGGPNSYRNNVGGDNTASGSACIPAGNIDLGGNSGL